MDPLSSPRLGRRARYPLPPHFSDSDYCPQRHPPFASFATHPAGPTPPAISRNHYYESRLVHPPGDLSCFPSPPRSNPPGFDVRHPPFPRVSDRAIHRVPPDGKRILPELWERGRGGSVDKPGMFDEGPDRFKAYDSYFKLGDPDRALVGRRRLESEQDRFLGDDSEWKNHRQLRFWDERESHYRDPFPEQLPPEAVPLAPPPFQSPRGLGSSGSVKNSGREDSFVFVHRHRPSSPPSSGRSFPNTKVVKSTGEMAAYSQVIGNGPDFKPVQSICKKRISYRDLAPDRGFGGRKYVGHQSIKKSDPIIISKEDGFWNGHHMARKASSISANYSEHGFEEDCYACYNGKMKMTSNRGAKYNAHSVKRPSQKPSAFARIQSGLSVWERLEEKPLILPTPCSAPSSLASPPGISNETESKANILDLSFKSNTLFAKVVEPFSAEPSSIEKDLFVEKPNTNGVTKKNNMTQKREKVIIPIISGLPSSSGNQNRVMKKKKKKNMIHMREKVVIPIVSSSPGSIAQQGVGKIFDVSSLGSISVLSEANKEELSSCMPGTKSMPSAWTKKVKKMVMAKKSGAKEVAKMSSLVDGCVSEAPRMEDGIETPKCGVVIGCTKEISNCNHSSDTKTEPSDDSHSQIYEKLQTMQATPTNNVSAKRTTNDVNQVQDIVIEILDDSGEESLELGQNLDRKCSSLNFEANVCLEPSGHIIDNIAAQDSLINMDENGAANSVKPIKPKLEDLTNSPPREIGQYILSRDNSASPKLLGAGGLVPVGSRTAYSDTSHGISTEIEIEREVKHQEEMVFSTATEVLEVPGNYACSQSYIGDIQSPSFSEISNSAPELKFHSEGIVKENNMLPQDVSNMTFRDSLETLTIDFCSKNIGQALLLGPRKMDSPATHSENLTRSHLEPSASMNLNNSAYSGNINEELGGSGEGFVSSMVSSASEPGYESGKTIKNSQLMSGKVQPLPNLEKKQVIPSPILNDKDISCKKTLPHADVSRFLSNRLNCSVSLKDTARASQTGRHRTWLRANSPLNSEKNLKLGGILSKQVPKKIGKIQNSSYFRKGNSLIRKLAAEPPPALLSTVGASNRKFKSITESSAREISVECPANATPYPLFERPKTPPLPPVSKLPGFTMNSCKDIPQLIPTDRSPEPDTDQGNQHDGQSTYLLAGNLESQDATSCKTVEIVNAKSVTYVKRKMNQLVAAQEPELGDSSRFLMERCQLPVHHPKERSKTLPISSSYLYYRIKRNQLIRNAISSDNVLQKAKMPARSSLVWTLNGDKLSQKCIAAVGCRRVFPYIFPWKRAVNWKSLMIPNNIPISSRSSVSLISRKLQCLRKRNTIYEVSTNGFSLRKAGVVSIGGSSLKWSKSIEKRSKKASEEATLAVAEVERKKRERKRNKSSCGNGKKKESLTCRSTSGIELKQGERIFRVGSARYKMDSSMRTLLRIPDDHSSSPASQISFVPRRLIIGNNEYVRIGTGNQLVRDPKKLKRILANEKVRWSLHSARVRLARKRQFCLFFTRFGKCNKSGRKCPYIHDPAKVAICTKFLKGQCSDANCKLTHKIIPERMPDCSYFLKGLCTNMNCPYRHVKVNANAPLCDGFLRGHCADGDECRKKHSYTCPLFEATGKCHQGSLCKLHHPKSQSQSRKRKRTKIQSCSNGRYFSYSIDKSVEPLEVPSSQNDLEGGNDIFCSDGRFTEYINLDVDSDNVAIKNDAIMESYSGKLESGFLDIQSCDIDALIKPVRIMNRDDLTIF